MDQDIIVEQNTEFDFDESEITAGLTGPYPIISFSDELENNLARKWNRALVVRLLGLKTGFKALDTRLKELWNMAKIFLLDLGSDFFLVSFSDDEEYWRSAC